MIIMASTVKYGKTFSVQDRIDLEKFIKFFAFKTVQIIVQSRLGQKIKSRSNSHSSGSDWFNLSIKDIPEIASETKRACGGELPCFNGNALNVEISLQTVEGDFMVLEIWSIGINDKLSDSNVRVAYTVYNRLGSLLKSLISVSRLTPAYKLSSRQGPDCYVICYKVYTGELSYESLGEGYKEIKLGQVITPLGSVCLNVSYRTKLTITPHKIEKETPLMLVKSNYFETDKINHDGHKLIANKARQLNHFNLTKPKEDYVDHLRSSIITDSQGSHVDDYIDEDQIFVETKKIGAFARPVNMEKTNGYNDVNSIPDAPFTSLLSKHLKTYDLLNEKKNLKNYNLRNGHATDGKHRTNGVTDNECDVVDGQNNELSTNGDSNSKNSLTESNYDNPSNVKICKTKRKNLLNGANDKLITSKDDEDDDFVLIELKTPFAGPDVSNDLGLFFHDCRTAPSLLSFSEEQQTLEEQFEQLSSQLADFEHNLSEYDNFVHALNSEEVVQ